MGYFIKSLDIALRDGRSYCPVLVREGEHRPKILCTLPSFYFFAATRADIRLGAFHGSHVVHVCYLGHYRWEARLLSYGS